MSMWSVPAERQVVKALECPGWEEISALAHVGQDIGIRYRGTCEGWKRLRPDGEVMEDKVNCGWHTKREGDMEALVALSNQRQWQ
jgi:hypothetical protein